MDLSPNSTAFAGPGTVVDSSTQYAADINGMLIGGNAERAGLSVGFVHPDFGGVGASAILDRGANTTP